MQTLGPLLLALLLSACTARIQAPQTSTPIPKIPPPTLPAWEPTSFHTLPNPRPPLFPQHLALPFGEVTTYGPQNNGLERFVVTSHREPNPKPGLFSFHLTHLPTSRLAGPSYLRNSLNVLHGPDRDWFYSAYFYRSTFFETYPATTETSKVKGLLVYHTSIMLLSVVEREIIKRFQRLGWHVLVALPPDSLYRTKVPALSSPHGQKKNAAALIAEDMDRHYLEQAYATKVALAYLAQTRPTWLTQKRILMGTSAGSFALPAEVLVNPQWDALVFISAGTNLLSLYVEDSAGLFQRTLNWLDEARRDPPTEVTTIFTDSEYQILYSQAAQLTRFHAGALAPHLQRYPTLMIAGTLDQIIPQNQALELHQALGSPERWTFPLGHHLLALQLIFEVHRLDHWISKNTQPKKMLETKGINSK